ncbi:hypothetical protein F5X96DRAFT_662082, partial [Biscogniauxia mediterranea]
MLLMLLLLLVSIWVASYNLSPLCFFLLPLYLPLNYYHHYYCSTILCVVLSQPHPFIFFFFLQFVSFRV